MTKASIYLSQEEYILVKMAAQVAGQSFSSFIKELAIKEAKHLVGDQLKDNVDDKQLNLQLLY